jgi:type I restriction enzyme R subunit
LSQIFDYGNTAVEKRAIFYRQVLRLLDFDREREGIDLSRVVLTHHTLKNQGRQPMPLADGENPKLEPITLGGQRGCAGETEGAAERDHQDGERPVAT